MDSEQLLDKARDVLWGLIKADLKAQSCLKFTDLYGMWGDVFTSYVSPLAFLIPSLVTTVMLTGFKLGKLFGPTQKFIISIMFFNLCFTLISSLRDGLLAAFDMNYGCIEYEVCSLILLSFHIQRMLNGTSIWITCLMILHQVIVVAYPFKVRLIKFKRIWFGCAVIHLTMVGLYQMHYGTPSFEKIPIMQEYRPGRPLKRITGCSPLGFDTTLSMPENVVFFSYFQMLPLLIHIVELLVLQYLYRKSIRNLAALTSNIKPKITKKVKFVVLMRVNMFLGISFVLQELPSVVLPLWGLYDPQVYNSAFDASQGLFIISISISFMIGKPIDVLIYASLSTAFRKQIKKILRRLACRRNMN
jgi:hypothetical protein